MPRSLPARAWPRPCGSAEIIKVSSGRSYGFEVYGRLPDAPLFAHGAMLLAKDVGLLGEVLGEDPAYAPFRDAARPFLDTIQNQNINAEAANLWAQEQT